MTTAFVLHRWPYQEHGLLLELFTAEHGRKRVIARGVRNPKNKWNGLLEPFHQLEVQWQGRGSLVHLAQADLVTAYPLIGHHLYSGFYLNELLQRLLPEGYPAPKLFQDYSNTLLLLAEQALLEPVLRRFEWQLLTRLELDFSWYYDAVTGAAIDVNQNYLFYPEQGFAAVLDPPQGAWVISGADILALADFQLTTELHLKQFKYLMRMALQPHLGNKPLQSRRLFQIRE